MEMYTCPFLKNSMLSEKKANKKVQQLIDFVRMFAPQTEYPGDIISTAMNLEIREFDYQQLSTQGNKED